MPDNVSETLAQRLDEKVWIADGSIVGTHPD
jgi:hypothetical protein